MTKAVKAPADVRHINDLGLTQKQKDGLLLLAMNTAEDLGYCDESNSVLEEMGFTPPTRDFEVTIKVTVKKLSSDYSEADLKGSWDIYPYNCDYEDLDFKVVSVEPAK